MWLLFFCGDNRESLEECWRHTSLLKPYDALCKLHSRSCSCLCMFKWDNGCGWLSHDQLWSLGTLMGVFFGVWSSYADFIWKRASSSFCWTSTCVFDGRNDTRLIINWPNVHFCVNEPFNECPTDTCLPRGSLLDNNVMILFSHVTQKFNFNMALQDRLSVIVFPCAPTLH